MEKLTKEICTEKEDEDIASLVYNLLGPSLRLAKKIVSRFLPFFEFSKYFWILISLFLVLLAVRFEILPINNALALFFVLIALEFVGSNFPILIQMFSPQERKRAFLDKLSEKNLDTIVDFIKEKKLTADEIKEILRSKFKAYPDVWNKINRFQKFGPEIVEFIHEEKLYEHTEEKIIGKLVLNSQYRLPKKTFVDLLKISSGYTRGALLVRERGFFSGKKLYQKLCYPLLSATAFIVWLIRGGGLIPLVLIAATVTTFALTPPSMYDAATSLGVLAIWMLILLVYSLLASVVLDLFLSGLLLLTNKIYKEIDVN